MANKYLLIITLGVYFAIYPILLCANVLSDAEVYSSLEFADYYHDTSPDEAHGYLIGYSSITGYRKAIGKNKLTVQCHQQEIMGEISQLSAPDDRISLSLPDQYLSAEYSISTDNYDYTPCVILGRDMGLKLELHSWDKELNHYGAFGARMRRAKIDYHIGTESGDIPFYWIESELRAGLKSSHYNAWLCYKGVYPYQSDSLFANKVYVNSVKSGIEADWGATQASVAVEYGLVLADLQYRGEQYGKIDKLQYMAINSSLYHTRGHWRYGAGVDSYLSGSGTDSYFDIWPFTYWDTFLAHRTRLKKLTVESVSPAISLNYSTQADSSDGLKLDIGFSYHHLIHVEDIIVKNRRVVMYPLIYTYDTDYYNWQNDVDAYIAIPISLVYKFQRSRVSFAIQQLAPFLWSDLFNRHSSSTEPPSNPPSVGSRWGGLTCHLGIELFF